jgi:NADPH:quinone reductase-like Zn-dependent oxidoreductase
MKAFALTSPDLPATLVELPDPDVPAGSVRVRVRAAGVNGIDVYQAQGHLLAMMEHHLLTVTGRDIAGVVDAVGPGRHDVTVGDEVFGFVPATLPLRVGTYAELVAGGAELVLSPKPAGLTFEVAAAIALASVAALDAVDAVAAGPGDEVLIVGATGGVGAIAVQLAAQRGATVTATARAGEDEAFARALGASETVDYAAEDVAAVIRARHPGGIAALIDVVSRDAAFVRMAEVVRDGGRIATSVGAADVAGLAARGIRATNLMALPTPAKLAMLAGQVAAGSLRVEIQRTFALAEAPAAHAAFTAGTRGKIVITIE